MYHNHQPSHHLSAPFLCLALSSSFKWTPVVQWTRTVPSHLLQRSSNPMPLEAEPFKDPSGPDDPSPPSGPDNPSPTIEGETGPSSQRARPTIDSFLLLTIKTLQGVFSAFFLRSEPCILMRNETRFVEASFCLTILIVRGNVVGDSLRRM